MNRYLNQFNQSLCCCLHVARGLMALGVLLVASKAATADVTFLGVDRQAKLSNDNTTATVTGWVTCSDEEMYNVSAVVVQNLAIGAGQLLPVGDFLPCTGSPIPFAVPVPVLIPADATFAEGPAEASVSALATGDPTGSDTQTVNTALELSN